MLKLFKIDHIFPDLRFLTNKRFHVLINYLQSFPLMQVSLLLWRHVALKPFSRKIRARLTVIPCRASIDSHEPDPCDYPLIFYREISKLTRISFYTERHKIFRPEVCLFCGFSFKTGKNF